MAERKRRRTGAREEISEFDGARIKNGFLKSSATTRKSSPIKTDKSTLGIVAKRQSSKADGEPITVQKGALTSKPDTDIVLDGRLGKPRATKPAGSKSR